MFVRLAYTHATSFLFRYIVIMSDTIDLQAFLEWYKKAEIVLGDKKRVFREPPIKDLNLKVLDILEKYCIEGDFKEFKDYLLNDITASQQKELLNKLMLELGLV